MLASRGAQRASEGSSQHSSTRKVRGRTSWFLLAALLLCVATGIPEGIHAASPAPYGPAIGSDSLNNSQVGGRFDDQVAYRFRATESSALRSIGVYVIGDGRWGYAGGNGGTLRITVRPDDRTKRHFPSRTVLATRDVVHPASGTRNEYSFPSPARLRRGRLYHIVFTNIDPSPRVNFVSLDGLFVFDEQTRWQPAFPNTDWANLVKPAGKGWSAYRGRGEGTITPIMQLTYANGRRAGVGYMEIWDPPRTISGTHKVRQVFTVRGDSRRVSSVAVRLRRLSGTSRLDIRLIRSDGKVVGRGSVSAYKVHRSDAGDQGGAVWAKLRFRSKVTLKSGVRYQLVLSSKSDTTYSVVVIREGGYYGYTKQTYFHHGSAQWTSGPGWTGFDPGWSGPSTEGDLQFYFR